MKFATVVIDGSERFGLVEGEDILLASGALLTECPDLKSAIVVGLVETAERLRAKGIRKKLDGLDFAPVIPNPAQIYCAGLNYVKHRDETRRDEARQYPKKPMIFSRFATTLAAHGEALPKPSTSDVVDYEGELAAVIGRECHRVSRDDALDYVAGYSCFNDISMRDWQMQAEQWIPGKNFPKSGPFGPFLVTPDETGPLGDLYLRTYLDGQLMQEAPFRDFVHDLPTLISHVSGFTRLLPGDVIVAGTPGGVGFTRNPPVLLEPGKTVVVDIEKVGRLENPIVAEA